MRARTCRVVRRSLSAYHDGELPIDEQVAVEAHLRQCRECGDEARELQSLSSMIRVGALGAVRPGVELGAFASNVVSRMKAERAGSLTGQTRALFDDLHLVWAALGATGATVACLAIVFTLFYFATTRENPESVAAMIARQASPWGSNLKPVSMADPLLQLPSAANVAFPEAGPEDQDAVFAMAATVTREGEVRDLNLLHGSDGTGPSLSARERREIKELIDTMSKARFAPARFGNSPVAIDMIWLYAQVNVRGKVPAGSKLQSPARELISSLPPGSSRAV
jgi:hypothetical protein